MGHLHKVGWLSIYIYTIMYTVADTHAYGKCIKITTLCYNVSIRCYVRKRIQSYWTSLFYTMYSLQPCSVQLHTK